MFGTEQRQNISNRDINLHLLMAGVGKETFGSEALKIGEWNPHRTASELRLQKRKRQSQKRVSIRMERRALHYGRVKFVPKFLQGQLDQDII